MDITSAGYAADLDAADPLSGFRDRFVVDDPELIYLDGNSLGRLPRAALECVCSVAEAEWGGKLVRHWGEWLGLQKRVGAKIARLIGAQEDEVICCDSTSVNLFKLVSAALEYQQGRDEIVTDDLNFPSDLYIMQGCARQAGPEKRIVAVPSLDDVHADSEAIEQALQPQTALMSITHVAFKSGYMHDMKRLTEAAHAAGALALWDLSHSVGAVPVDLNGAGVDLAVGCTYKYLNGGPGSPAFLYVRRDLQERLLSPIWGWFGERKPFDFRLDYEPAAGINRFFAGTPPILSMAGVEAGADLVLEAGMGGLREKSVRQTEYLIQLYDALLAPLGVELKSPREAGVRGSHVSFGHPDGLRVDRALIEDENVIPDFRAPDNIRFGVTPLYTTFSEIREAMVRMARVISERTFERFGVEELAVT